MEHWGEWVIARSRAIGFRRLMDLAKAVGCSAERITQWGAAPEPPMQMRKGFDAKLAYALQTTRRMLFSEWRKTSPESAERLLLHPDQLALHDFDFLPIETPVERVLKEILPLLAPSEAEWLLRQAALKVLEAGTDDQRTAIFRQIVERFKLFEHFAATGARLPSLPASSGDAPATKAPPLAPPPAPRQPSKGTKISRAEWEAAEALTIADQLKDLAAREDPAVRRLNDELQRRAADELHAKLPSNSMINVGPTAEEMAAFEADQVARKTAAAERDRLAAIHAARKRAKSPDPPPRR